MAASPHDQEKLQEVTRHSERRQHNDAPSQKTAMPRWPRRGKGKSTVSHICSWVVEHQIGELASKTTGNIQLTGVQAYH